MVVGWVGWGGGGYSLPVYETAVADHGVHCFPTTTLSVINLNVSETGGTEAHTCNPERSCKCKHSQPQLQLEWAKKSLLQRTREVDRVMMLVGSQSVPGCKN